MVDDASAVLDKTDTPAEEVDYSWPFGKRHRRSRRLIVALLLLIPVWFGFEGEMRAAWWHVRHGFHYDFHGYSYYVPPDAYVVEAKRELGDRAMIFREPGRARQVFRAPWYRVTLSWQDKPGRFEEQFAKQDRAVVKNITHRSSPRTVNMAGTPLTCYSIDGKFIPASWHLQGCYRETIGIVAAYSSYPTDAGMFDEIMESAKKK